MRVVRRWIACCLATAALTASLPAAAHLLFTYTSQVLPLSSYSVNEELWDLDELGEMEPIQFALSFTAAEQDLSLSPLTEFRFTQFNFALISPNAADVLWFPLDMTSSRSGGQVTLDQDGDVVAWNLLVRMTELITPETDMFFHRLERHFVAVKSSGGTDTCNCDKFTNRFHPITWHRHWIQLAKIQMSYSDSSNPGGWTVAKIAVPEPRVAGLLLAGLLGLLWSRRSNRGSRR